jgi:predicted XRE-type DNA-binding protein
MPRQLRSPRHSRRGGPDREHMRIRRALLSLILEIARRDQLADYNIANICRTSRPRASTLLHGHIARFNSETLIDILWRLGVTLDVTVVSRRPYLRWSIDAPRPGWRPPPGVAPGDPVSALRDEHAHRGRGERM